MEKIQFKFDKEHEFSTIRKVYINGKYTGYSIKTVFRPTYYAVRKEQEVVARFVLLEQAKDYVIEQLQKEVN